MAEATQTHETDAPVEVAPPPSAMRIESIRIKNFRSYEDTKLDCSPFNILVGRNNHGKSNFIEALEWFYTGKSAPNEIRRNGSNNEPPNNEPIEVEVTFSNVQEGLKEISNTANQEKIRNIINEHDVLRVRRSSSSDPKKREIQNPSTSEWQVQPCGADSTFNNCIPRFEFVQTTKNLKEIAAYKSTSPIGQLLSGLLQSVLNKDDSSEFKDFLEKFDALFGDKDPNTGNPSQVRSALNEIGNSVKEHLENQFPDCKDVSFDITPPEPEDLLKGYRTTLDDGVITSAEEKGDGMQRALMLAIIKAHADFRREDAVGRSFIFFIDEAELHLHPTAQRQLKESLLKLAQTQDQVFITTHSSVFIADTHEDQSLFSVTKEDGITNIAPIKNKTDLQNTVFELLGGSPADLLLPPNFLIVEGPSEVALLKGLLRKFYVNKPNIQIISACGDDEAIRNQYDAVNKILNIPDGKAVYCNKIVVLLDKPDAGKTERFETFKRNNSQLESSDRLFVLSTETLEDCYPSQLNTSCPHSNKVKKARWMAEQLTKEQFENDMETVFKAVSKCWNLAFSENRTEEDIGSGGGT